MAAKKALEMQFAGKRVLVVEDELLVALGLEVNLQELGCTVIGPASSLAAAMLAAAHETVDAAILDINLAGERVFPAAAILHDRGIPFMFCSGQSVPRQMPPFFTEAPRVPKPYTRGDITCALADLLGADEGGIGARLSQTHDGGAGTAGHF